MKKVVNNAYELIGETPILNAKKYAIKNDILNVELLVKLEYLNPAGSVKDRIAYAMIIDAEKKWQTKTWRNYNRANKWKYWYWYCFNSNTKRI